MIATPKEVKQVSKITKQQCREPDKIDRLAKELWLAIPEKCDEIQPGEREIYRHPRCKMIARILRNYNVFPDANNG